MEGMGATPISRDFVHQLARMRVGEHVDVPGHSGVRCRMDSDGRVFLLEPDRSGTRETFLFRKVKGTIFLGTDYIISEVSIQ